MCPRKAVEDEKQPNPSEEVKEEREEPPELDKLDRPITLRQFREESERLKVDILKEVKKSLPWLLR